ncbi:MAG: PepSY-associated TM helix domain-containing protein [Azonexaceae bacterium]|nr:PepSY-associated TM helix domain-containing protein [Azonexaceae bacterium]
MAKSHSLPLADVARPVVADRSATLKLLLKIHWISSALCLLGMLLFSVTGITLNHASQIESTPKIERRTLAVPAPLLAELTAQSLVQDGKEGPLPAAVVRWAADSFRAHLDGVNAEWSADEVYVALPRPGGDAWLRFALEDAEAEFEVTDRGWISWLNDLHKGRHTGAVWSWFIDIFAVACLLFSLSGLWVLKIHAARRHSTWPLVGLGVLIPVLIALLFIH